MGRQARRGLNMRVVALGVLLMVMWAAVGIRLFEIQSLSADEYAARGEDQRLRREVLAADRGTVFDRDGNELAVTVDSITIYANPRQVEDPAATAAMIAPLLAAEPAEIEAALRRDTGFSYVARQLDRATADNVRQLDLAGIYFTEEPRRTYPSGSLASHVVGFVRADDNEGLEGVELFYDEVLAGTPGEVLVERSAAGQVRIPLGAYEAVPALPGSDLVLTIDREIQFEAQRALAEAVATWNAAGGSVVVLEPATGDVLALANLPTFDPNERDTFDPAAMRNRAVVDVYEPGSTLKLVTVAAAIEEGIVTPGTVLDIPHELVIEALPEDKVYTDVGNTAGPMTVADVVRQSSNKGTIMIQQLMGNETLHRYLARFGLGRQTGLDFPGEAGGVLHPVEQWCSGPCGPNTAIGYNVSVTPLQMATVFAAVANDGVLAEPRLVREFIHPDGTRQIAEVGKREVLSSETAAVMRSLLRTVVEDGTGTAAAVAGYEVGGKTGTTEKYLPDEQRYGSDVVASFIGIAPIDDPAVVVAVTIDSPAGGAFGGQVAAPVFADVTLSALHQLGVSPDG